MAWRIGVDSGGTFTDICLLDERSGRTSVWKVSSTPADPSRAVAEGVGEALNQIEARASDISYFGHGTTVATNALIVFAIFSRSVGKNGPTFTICRRTSRLSS